MHCVYILKSIGGKYYIGSTCDVDKRICKHNNGSVRSTKAYRPWRLVYTEQYGTKIETLKREKEIKSWKKRIAIDKLIFGAIV
ncbi:GIY-YIG nuclease family protein [Patescibacteria group bacterium]|nr:GIY-YIG nuclease family protein [Patescibacteria group bacterium]MBU1473209.1 GIY-YIG nuclease family protein [Patescibacteria group bacterium]MBU2459933.1 GIY-YIG nuclease family protein [Patescibacteria group bacterium]